MKDKMMICNRANDCGWADCADRTPHSQDYMCSDKCKILPDAKCIPIEPQPATCPDCGHPVNSHTYDGGGYEPAVFCKCLRTRNQAIQGKDYCTSEWREYNCLDKETCPTLSDGSICTHYRRTPADLPENCSGCLGATLHHTCGKEPDATKQPTPTMPLLTDKELHYICFNITGPLPILARMTPAEHSIARSEEHTSE